MVTVTRATSSPSSTRVFSPFSSFDCHTVLVRTVIGLVRTYFHVNLFYQECSVGISAAQVLVDHSEEFDALTLLLHEKCLDPCLHRGSQLAMGVRLEGDDVSSRGAGLVAEERDGLLALVLGMTL